VQDEYDDQRIPYYTQRINYLHGDLYLDMIDLIKTGIHGIFAISLLVIGVRMLVVRRPILFPARLLACIFAFGFSPMLISSADFIFGDLSGYTDRAGIFMLLAGLVIIVIALQSMSGYAAIGVTPDSLRGALQSALQQLNLPYQESLSRIKLTTIGADLKLSISGSFSIVYISVNKRQHKPILKSIIQVMKQQFASVPGRINLKAGVFLCSIGLVMVVLTVSLLVLHRVKEFTGSNYAEPEKLVGKLNWVIREAVTGKTIDNGAFDIHLRDITVKGVYDRGVSLFSPRIEPKHFAKEIKLNRDFYLSKLEFPRAERNFGEGVGLSVENRKFATTGHEFFKFDGEHHATKAEESGDIAFDMKKINSRWEMARTEFLSDVTFRVNLIGQGDIQENFPKWRVTILKGSYVNWPSLVGDTVTPIY
jgi:hypothetical protein